MGIYKIQGSPYWQFDFTVKGQRHRGSTEAAKKSEALAIYTKRRSEALLGNFYESKNSLTLNLAFFQFEKEHASHLKSYSNSIQYHIDHLLNYFGRDTALASIGQAELQKYVSDCRVATYKPRFTKEDRITSPATVNRRIAVFRKMHKLALTWGADIQPIDFSALRLEEPESPNNTLSHADAEKLLEAAPEHLRHFIWISLFTGLRMSNVLSLRGDQIDMDSRIITAYGKSKKPGGKKLSKVIVDNLYNYIRLHKLDERERVITYRGQPVKSVATAWKAAFENAKLPYIRRHDLRHTFGTWLYAATGDIHFVQEALDHANINTTLRYAHSQKDRVRKRMNKAFAPKLRQTKPVRVK